MNIKNILIIFTLICLLSVSNVTAHGVDVTDNHMVIADNNNGVNAKNLADSNKINISVYKFTSASEVEHILLHSVNNTDKRIVVIAYQDEARSIISKYPELKDRVFISSDNDEDLLNAMMLVDNTKDNSASNNDTVNFALPLIVGLVLGLIIGLGAGVFLSHRKK
ncbi:hypothetical protein [Methanobrevibacter sp. UBA46]|uniref:hypothetical protein n=1 Tax=Methanobrevibacter sp. UBA46 TaxID=1915488 RepID=UPI0039B98F9A